MTKYILILIFISSVGQAKEEAKFPLDYSIKFSTDFPLWMGGGAEIIGFKKYALGAGFGLMPTGFSNVVSSMVSTFSGNPSYQTLVSSMLQQNSSFKIYGEYRFTGEEGWFTGLGVYFFNATGDASITDVLEAITGQSYTILKAILAAQGRSLVAHSISNFSLGEIHGGYSWKFKDALRLRAALGVAKVLDSSISLSSNAPAFDNSQAGQNTYNYSISYIRSILATYGISPYLEVSFAYLF